MEGTNAPPLNSRTMKYRLAVDLGAASIGWAILRLRDNEPCAVIKAGVRTFSTGRTNTTGTSLAAERRMARQARRQRDRRVKRKNRLIRELVALGFWPSDPAQRRALSTIDPYDARLEALDCQVMPAVFGRAVFHLNMRRGFLSNRKTAKPDEDGAVHKANATVTDDMQLRRCRTVGEWLHQRRAAGLPVRARRHERVTIAEGKGPKTTSHYDFYVSRAMVANEFDALWETQARFDPATYSAHARERLRDVLLHQRPLVPVRPGKCPFVENEDRLAWAMPSAQRRRIYEDANHLRVIEPDLSHRPLSLVERDVVVDMLERSIRTTVPFDAIRKRARLASGSRFTIEREGRKGLKPNGITQVLANPACFGKAWHTLTLDHQDEIVRRILGDDDEQSLIEWLMTNFHLDGVYAEEVAASLPMLPSGYSRLGATATRKVLAGLESAVIRYDEAVEQAGFGSHSALSHLERTGVLLDSLPYYGEVLGRKIGTGTFNATDPIEKRYGRFPNPTVHVGLNQLRKVVNALTERYGRPEQVAVELARELRMSQEQKRKGEKRQAENQKRNDAARSQIAALLHKGRAHVSPDELLRWQLWVDSDPRNAANRCCPYTGRAISALMVFSSDVAIDHIIPWSASLDDSRSNLVLCLASANTHKGDRTPFAAFAHSPTIDGQRYDWDAIVARAKSLPESKTVRFSEKAHETFLGAHENFLARALTDTAYLSRLAREYLTVICPDVWVTAGRLTAILRGQFGLNTVLGKKGEKNREDHRHHAIDAIVVGVTDRSLLQRFATANASPGKRLPIAPVPWATFRSHVERAVSRIIVSHRPEHNASGALHNDTAYGLLPNGRVRHFVDIATFETRKKIEETEFANPRLQAALLAATEPEAMATRRASHDDMSEARLFKAAVATVANTRGIRRVRVIETLRTEPIIDALATHRHGVLPDGTPRPYKGFKTDSNHQLRIWTDATGNVAWRVVTTHEANQPGCGSEGINETGKRLVLHGGDYVSVETERGRRLMRVQKFSSKDVVLVEPHEANADRRERNRAEGIPSLFLRKAIRAFMMLRPRLVTVSALGECQFRT